MAFKIRWTSPAASDFENLARYIEARSDPMESQRVAKSLFSTISGLAEFPHLDTELEDYPGLRRRPCEGFSIIYQTLEKEQVVEIIRILSQRQNLDRHL